MILDDPRINPHLDALTKGRERLYQERLADPNIVGTGIGMRMRNGRLTEEPAIIAMVVKKRPAAHVAASAMLPSTMAIDGRDYGVDVIETGAIYAGGPPVQEKASPTEIWDKFRPAVQGAQIGNINAVATPPLTGYYIGTLGCFVRDKTDDTICILSNNHVLARGNRGQPGEKIFQPYPSTGNQNVIGELKRAVPLKFWNGPANPNVVDGAIASISEPLASKAIANNLMNPISAEHPVIGLGYGGSTMWSFICPIESTLTSLNIELVAKNAVQSKVTLGMNMDKVGRTTGYTSSFVWGIGGIDINYGTKQEPLIAHFYPTIFTFSMMLGGDSGSIICRGGPGNILAPVSGFGGVCGVSGSIGAMYDLPLEHQLPHIDRLRDEVLALSPLGRMAIALTYINQPQIEARAKEIGEATKVEKDNARAMYDKYRDFVVAALDDPHKPGLTFTAEHMQDLHWGLTAFAYHATPEELAAADTLFQEFVPGAVGKNYKELLALAHDKDVIKRVAEILQQVPTLELHGGPVDAG